MDYRRDIDGLRAVAVLVVVLFHAKLPGFSGGFVGVDIFFVISGYLITGLILSEAAAGRFSLLGFYFRRVKRIVPALLVVYLASATLAAALMLPTDSRAFARALTASALFVSNILFWQEAGYFDTLSELKPLLHTWSLSIEEQFYLVWPVVCALAAASRLRWLSLLAWTLGAASLAAWLALIWSGNGASAFFLTPFRVWELMLGAGLALAVARGRRALGPRAAETAAAVGALLILGAVCAPLEAHWLEAYLGLPAALGALLLIASGSDRQTAVARLLSIRPMVGVGLISYSLYLWHWPLLAFARYHFDRALAWNEVASLLLLSLIAAVVTYRFVEQPLRRTTWFRREHAVAAGVACLAVFALAGFRMERDRGWTFNLDPEIRRLSETAASKSAFHAKCLDSRSVAGSDEACTFGRLRQDGSFDLVIFGDSHANHFTPAISLLARAAGLSGRQVVMTGCLALLGDFVVESPTRGRAHCSALPAAMMRFVEQNPRLRVVVLAHAWSVHTGRELIAKEGRKTNYLLASSDDERSEKRSIEILRGSLDRTLDYFAAKGIQVLLVGEIPPFAQDPIGCVARAIKQGGRQSDCRRELAQASRVIGETNALLAEHARTRRNVLYFSPSDTMCAQGWCNAVVDGVYMYQGATHLNRLGAEHLAQVMRLPEPQVVRLPGLSTADAH